MSDFTVPRDALAPSSEKSLETPVALQVPTKSVGVIFLLLFCLATLVIWMGIFPVLQILIPIQITALDAAHKISDYSIISVLGALTSLITFPLVGALSDRTTLRLGRRRPWILTGILGAAIMLAFLASASSIVMLAIGWVLFTVFASFTQAGLFTLIPDKVPARQRATVSAFIGLSVPIGIALGSTLIGRVTRTPQLSYYTIMGLMLFFVLLFALVLHDEPLPKEVVPPFKLGAFMAGFWVNPAQHPNFGWAWLTRFLFALSYACGTGYLFFFLQDAVHYDRLFQGRSVAQGVSTFQQILTLLLLIACISSGFFSDRLQRRKIFVIVAGLVMALALLLLAFFPSWSLVVVAAGVLGLGYGIYVAVDLALVIHVLPSAQNRGKDMGVINIAATIPQALAPVLIGVIVSKSHSYLLLFLLAAAFSLLASLLIPRIKGVN